MAGGGAGLQRVYRRKKISRVAIDKRVPSAQLRRRRQIGCARENEKIFATCGSALKEIAR